MRSELLSRFKKIKLLITDVDGVLTDGHFHFDHNGIQTLRFNAHDGLGLVLLQLTGINVGVITTSKNPIIEKRIKGLRIPYYYNGIFNKIEAYRELKEILSLSDDEIAYVGDDVPDLEVIEAVGLGVAVNNANPVVKARANYITEKSGGMGAIREICDLIMDAQGTREQALQKYKTEYDQ